VKINPNPCLDIEKIDWQIGDHAKISWISKFYEFFTIRRDINDIIEP